MSKAATKFETWQAIVALILWNIAKQAVSKESTAQ